MAPEHSKFPAITVDFDLTEARVGLRDVSASRLADLAPGHARVRPLYVALCATDKGLDAGTHGAPRLDSPILVTGHEAVCEIVDLADDLNNNSCPFKIGDRVMVKIRMPNDDVDPDSLLAKRPDRFHDPDNWHEFGMFRQDGALTYLRSVPIEQLVLIPNGEVNPEHYVLGDGVTCVIKNIRALLLERSNKISSADNRFSVFDQEVTLNLPLQEKLNTLVIGAGSIGQSALMVLRSLDHSVTVVDTLPEDSLKARLVNMLGGTYRRIDITSNDYVTAVRNENGPFSLIFDGSGSDVASELWSLAADNMGVIGTLSIPHGSNTSPGQLPQSKELKRNQVLRDVSQFATVNAGPEDWLDFPIVMARVQNLNPGYLNQLLTLGVPFDPKEITAAASDPTYIKPVVAVAEHF